MQGWQMCKQLHFAKHGEKGGAWQHPVYGWQAGPDMVKLSLLVLLDGEANDMVSVVWRWMGEAKSRSMKDTDVEISV